jgi:hypothetical protein
MDVALQDELEFPGTLGGDVAGPRRILRAILCREGSVRPPDRAGAAGRHADLGGAGLRCRPTPAERGLDVRFPLDGLEALPRPSRSLSETFA